ncbi:MAG: response regulator transcription factor [Bryobacterales bacterium]|nr:response regulator transcription factor [Bryobacterales bacterium]
MKIRVLLVDDHPVVLSGLAAILCAQPDIEVCGEARSGDAALAVLERVEVDVVLLDLHMPGMDGWSAMEQIREKWKSVRVIAISSFLGDEDVHRALAAGAKGYLPKDSDASEITAAVRTVHRGLRSISADAASALASRIDYEELSAREMEVLQAIAHGRSNKEIAAEIGVTESTVKQHVGSILSKLGVEDRTGAVVLAMERGLIRRWKSSG